MKIIYFAVFFLFTIGASSQEIAASGNTSRTEPAGFKLYPNPAYNDVVYITTARNELKEIIVYDVFGEVVLTDRITTNSLNISRLTPGVYVLQVTENTKSMTRKLVVK